MKNRLYYHQNPEPFSKHFSAKYKLKYLLHFETYHDVDTAIKREKQLKKWNRKKKEMLINQLNPEWRFLNDEIKECK